MIIHRSFIKDNLLKLKNSIKSFFQKIVITIELFGINGLANHAAAGAYGFLLSLAPLLLLIAFFILAVFKSKPDAINILFERMPFLDILIDEQWLVGNFLAVTKPGIPGVISIISIFWAGRILALAMQRGLKIIFLGPKSRNPIKETLVTLALEISVLLFVLILVFGSQTALNFYRLLDFISETSFFYIVPKIGNRIFPISALGIASFLTYLLVPANSPCKLSAFQGALLFALCLFGVNITFTLILNHANYNLLYGTLGNLILLLVNVYFFFLFFFIGAQFAYVTDTFDALLFSKIRQTRIPAKMIDNTIPVKTPWDIKLMRKIFNPFEGNLKKYLHFYKKGEVIILKGDVGDDVFYIIDGEAEILLSPDVNETDNLQNSINDKNYSAGVLEAGSFFGEMGYLLSEERCATIKAKTDISVYALPHLLFDSILKYDTNIDIEIIEHMSRRLKDTTKHITSAG